MHNISINHKGNDIKMKKFSSQRLNSIFIDQPILPNVNITAFEHTNAGDNLEEAINKSIELINNNSGFEITLWYSRGKINDQALVGLKGQEGTQVDACKINYHIVMVKPENLDFKNNLTILSRKLESMKFKVGNNF